MFYSSHTRGLAAIILAYSIWGLFPVYWKLLGRISPTELLFIRLILTSLSCLLLLPLRGSWKDFRAAWQDRQQLATSLFTAILLSGNWFAFIWAVNNGRVMESSLGYFLCPLVSVLLGRVIEHEHLGVRRWLAVGLAAAGVGTLVIIAGRLPLAAICIALTWGGYAVMKKRTTLGPVVGLGMETSLLAPVSAVILLIMAFQGPLTITTAPSAALGFLTTAGFLTAAPLLLFAFAAQRIRLSTMGMGQYIVPSAHLGLAVLYGEPVTGGVLAGFALIWCGLVVYSLPQRKRGTASEKGV
ncbi:EamA family transporter RarD [Puniceicoccales bacterium CK1056]|uniref:EamA family transporter RarD n=1 Tax=Oceanipulchritudo coccoides TaxID=2706888 RepID=A0A6B2M2C8_9BACT|nr:EamA family transporter RarD [Oceanipulchritudo coccoides]NDV61955.1 EamA family transporter RarD [Oceanipulchritudo coccoides]